MLSITVLYLAFPLMIVQSSYNAIYAYFKKTRHFKVLALSLVNTRSNYIHSVSLFAGFFFLSNFKVIYVYNLSF